MTVLVHPTESENLPIESERACALPCKDLYQFCSFSGLFTRLGYILLKGNPNVKGWSETGEAGTMSGVSYMCFRHWHASRTRLNIVLGPVRQTGPMVCPNICTARFLLYGAKGIRSTTVQWGPEWAFAPQRSRRPWPISHCSRRALLFLNQILFRKMFKMNVKLELTPV